MSDRCLLHTCQGVCLSIFTMQHLPYGFYFVDRRTALRTTWMAAAPDSVVVKFVLYEKERDIDVQRESDLFHDIIFVQGGTTTDYRSIVYKTFAFIQVCLVCNPTLCHTTHVLHVTAHIIVQQAHVHVCSTNSLHGMSKQGVPTFAMLLITSDVPPSRSRHSMHAKMHCIMPQQYLLHPHVHSQEASLLPVVCSILVLSGRPEFLQLQGMYSSHAVA